MSIDPEFWHEWQHQIKSTPLDSENFMEECRAAGNSFCRDSHGNICGLHFKNISFTLLAEKLEYFPHLTHLSLTHCGITRLDELPQKLHALTISQKKAPHLESLPRLKFLQELGLEEMQTLFDLSPVKTLPVLKELDLSESLLSQNLLDSLAGWKAETLTLFLFWYKGPGTLKLPSMEVDGDFCLDFSNSPLTKLEGLENLSLHASFSLDLNNSKLQTLEGMEGLNCPERLEVDLSHTPLKSLSGIEKWKYSELELELEGTRIEDLSPLCRLEAMSYLDLEGYPGMEEFEVDEVPAIQTFLAEREGKLLPHSSPQKISSPPEQDNNNNSFNTTPSNTNPLPDDSVVIHVEDQVEPSRPAAHFSTPSRHYGSPEQLRSLPSNKSLKPMLLLFLIILTILLGVYFISR
jgi:hypothetical protein